ncbi:MAG: 16S rRNA processing protein RimM [Thermodesulfatator sp.]|nr:MAG: 16S rRNA processing protein RimM [Thermodesulfatator sp.]
MAEDRFIKIGKILRPVGLGGQVLLKVFSQLETVSVPGSFFIRSPSGRYEEFFISRLVQKDEKQAVCSLKWVNSRERAERLAKCHVYQKFSRLPRPEEDEYYWFELKGMEVVGSEGTYLGRIHSVMETGASDILVVRNKDREILVPMVDQVIKKIEKKKKRCVVELPPGLAEATMSNLQPR